MPKPLGLKNIMSRFCEDCFLKNLLDGMDFPTPPEFLDRHTLNPCLTEAEFQKQLRAIKP